MTNLPQKINNDYWTLINKKLNSGLTTEESVDLFELEDLRCLIYNYDNTPITPNAYNYKIRLVYPNTDNALIRSM